MKKVLSFFTFFSIFTVLCANNYKISNVNYELHGQTRKYALDTKVEIDKNRIFKNEDELIKYIEDYKIRLNNIRAFENISVDFKVHEADENDILPVELFVITDDSHHMLIVPYPKYSSTSGLNIKLKARDTNFLGFLETMSSEVKIEMCGSNPNPVMGFGFNFDVPFKLKTFDAVWLNSYDIEYEVSKKSPSWNFMTGLKLTKNFKKFSIVNQFNQYSVRKVDYDYTTTDGKIENIDELTYFTESYMFAVPITVQDIDNWGKVLYTPAVTFAANWTCDDINDTVRDSIVSQGIVFLQTLSTARANWIENFRNGLAISIGQSVSYAFTNNAISSALQCEIMLYKAIEIPIKNHSFNFGINSRIYGFANLKGYTDFGDRLRGIVSDQKFAWNETITVEQLGDEQFVEDYFNIVSSKACSSRAGLVVNVDVPIKLGRIYWEYVPIIKHIKFARYFDMEVQVSPFIDFALCHNKVTGSFFNPADGFLSGGIEGIIFPLKMRGLQVRASLGVDLSRKMPYLKGKFNQDWRDSTVKSYELSIGIGLHY